MQYRDDVLIEGTRNEDGEMKVFIDDRPLPHVVHHSPTGFNVGYGGSGPADLALSILAAVIGDEQDTVTIFSGRCGRRAWQWHQAFKRDFVTRWGDDWGVTVGDVRRWIKGRETD